MSDEFAGLKTWWQDALSQYEALRADAHARVTRWLWAPFAASWEQPVPYPNERIGSSPRTRELPGPPTGPEGADRYGRDASGRIIVAETHSGDGIQGEEFFHDVDGGVRSASFGWDGSGQLSLRALTETRPSLERPELHLTYSEDTFWSRSEIQRDDDRVLAIHERWHLEEEKGEVAEVITPHYDERGRLEQLTSDTRISYDENSQRVVTKVEHVLWRRPSPGRAKRARAAEDYLADGVPHVVAGLALEEPVGYVVVLYDYAVGLPPMLGVETAARRDALRLGAEIEEMLFIGDLAASTIPDAFPPPPADAQGALDDVNQAIRSGDGDLLRRIAIKVAKRLNDVTWPAEIQLADDFFVIAIDADMTDPVRDAKASIPAHRRRWLKSRRLVP